MKIFIPPFQFTSYLIFFILVGCSTTPNTSVYSRNSWGGWTTKNCVNTRHRLLKDRAIGKIKNTLNRCRVVDGRWLDFYSGEQIDFNDHPQIDHIIPLKYAHSIGANLWSREVKNKFYNDPQNLVITSRSMNIEKSDKGFLKWHPFSHELSCKYAYRWISVKIKYDLKFSEKECMNFKVLESSKPCFTKLPKIKNC